MRNQRATGRDMLISLAVILVPAALIYVMFSRIPDEPEVPVAPLQTVVENAREKAPFQVLSPTNLPDDWKPVRARYQQDELQLGLLSPEKVYFEVKQRPGANQSGFVKTVTREGVEEGSSTVIGRTWTRMVTEDGRSHCLVNVVEKGKPATTVVCGDASYEAVEAFASTLA
ncbi:DUF4245 domain-containing protein [Luteococcus sp. Sow4_B9]|uniref:DUF4245 domain-containing protein n=1 Tax=Luteococcus sp. Sow4_B9 TaxID=3438792 RepID=UPI003F9E3E66